MTADMEQGVVPPLTLGWRLRMALEHAGMTVQGMAAQLGVDRRTVSRWLHDEGRRPQRAFVAQWALATGVAFDWLANDDSPGLGGPGLSGDEIEALRDLVRRQGLEPRTRWLRDVA